MKVLYLYNKIRKISVLDIESGVDHDNHFFGMYRLQKLGINTGYIELESVLPEGAAKFLRKHFLNIHFAHLPLLPFLRKSDIVFTSTAFGTLLVKTLLGMKKPKWVIFDYGLRGLIGDRKTLKQKILFYMVSRVDGIVTLSKEEQVDMQAILPHMEERIIFVPLGTDTKFFFPKDRKEEDFVLSVGRDPGRDFKTLFDALSGTNIHVKLTAKPEQLKKFLPLPTYVSIHNFTPQELVEQYAKAKVIAITLAPRHQGDAMGCSTLVEAMAMGKAIVATNTGTMSSYLTNNHNGVLVPQKDSMSLRLALQSLLADTQTREAFGSRAREFAVLHCDAELFAHRLAVFFKSLV